VPDEVHREIVSSRARYPPSSARRAGPSDTSKNRNKPGIRSERADQLRARDRTAIKAASPQRAIFTAMALSTAYEAVRCWWLAR
jgi:hypothetical protein